MQSRCLFYLNSSVLLRGLLVPLGHRANLSKPRGNSVCWATSCKFLPPSQLWGKVNPHGHLKQQIFHIFQVSLKLSFKIFPRKTHLIHLQTEIVKSFNPLSLQDSQEGRHRPRRQMGYSVWTPDLLHCCHTDYWPLSQVSPYPHFSWSKSVVE